MVDSGSFPILVVCTANICRSPMAEYLVRQSADERELPLMVSSAGFLFDDEEASPRTIAAMDDRAVDLSAHRSRIVTPAILSEPGVIVTMERRHARELIVEHSVAVERVFTLGGLADTLADLDADPGTPPADRIAWAAGCRGAEQLLSTGPDEVADPHGRSRRRHRLTADRIAVLVEALLDGMFGSAADD